MIQIIDSLKNLVPAYRQAKTQLIESKGCPPGDMAVLVNDNINLNFCNALGKGLRMVIIDL